MICVKNYLFFKMLAENSKLVTFVNGRKLEIQLIVNLIITSTFLEPITNLKKAIIFTSLRPSLVRA